MVDGDVNWCRQHTSSGADLDVQSGDAELLAAGSDVLGSQHGSVGGGLVTVSLDLHATGDTADGLAATVISQNVSKGIHDCPHNSGQPP